MILRDDPRGMPRLFERHGALFREGLIRFFGAAKEEQIPHLDRMLRTLASDLKAGRFDDLVETFYDWVVRNSFSTCMAIRIEQAGGEHLDPGLIYECSDRLNEAALPEDVREKSRAHFQACDLCREMLQKSKDVPVEVRHAGARFPEEFRALAKGGVEGL